jgi:uridine monophosphate synthetase
LSHVTPFHDKLRRRMLEAGSLLCVGLDPDLRRIPAQFSHANDPLLAFNQWVIERTAPFASAFKLNSSFYEAQGVAGWEALRRSIAAIPPEIPAILDAKRGDVGPSSEAYAQAVFEVLKADAVTVNSYLGMDVLEPFFRRPEHGLFVLCHTSNPGASTVQDLWCEGRPLYTHIAKMAEAQNLLGNVGLVVGATFPEALARLRELTPKMTFLVPGVGAQSGDLEKSVVSGLDAEGLGLVINVSRGVIYEAEPDAAAEHWRDQINAARSLPRTVAGTAIPPVEALALDLHAAGCVRLGEFKLHSGEVSPIYVDLRLLVSFPSLLQRVAREFASVLRGLEYERLAAIPYAALPIGTAVSLEVGRPLVYPRKEAKSYGTRRAIEGQFSAGERAVVLDDVITTGDSKMEAIAPLLDAGLQVRDVVVLVDREQGGAERLRELGYRLHSVLKLSTVLDALLRHGRITTDEHGRVQQWLVDRRGAQS